MTVTVRTPRTSSGSRPTFTYPEATNVDVKDGHLLVRTWRNGGIDNVAVYAPGQWTDATTDEPAEK